MANWPNPLWCVGIEPGQDRTGKDGAGQDRTVSQPSKRLDASLNLSDFLCARQAQEKREINRDRDKVRQRVSVRQWMDAIRFE